ncbi:MAG: DNA repair protein RadA [Alphaproteobacteria bacterium]|nr:DNA repair protein RadA [Alphaproteobacteria bacterium]
MARSQTRYICQSCGQVHPRWVGKCDGCGAWNTLAEEVSEKAGPKATGGKGGRHLSFVELSGAPEFEPRRPTGIAELDRVLGGGIVPGSAILVGGDPGIGKSTLLLQAAARLSEDRRIAYISGEEAVDQIRMRAIRLGVEKSRVALAASTNVRDIVASLDHGEAPEVAIIDSIQTMYVDTLESAPGTVGQVRAASQELIRLAKRKGTALILVGHVTKDGMIAGPKVLEHMVDTVLHFEGERGHQFRILRSIKNRYGPTDEIGVFEMTETGLGEVANPSALFLADRSQDVSGAAVFAGMEGTRPVLVEVQALVAPSPLGTPRRTVVGWDTGRLAMTLAVLEARAGLSLGGYDVFLNVAGGFRIQEPAADLAVAAALVSAVSGTPCPSNAVVFGELGLSGEIRAVSQTEARLKEAAKLGFDRALIPRVQSQSKNRKKIPAAGLGLDEMGTIGDLFDLFPDAHQAARHGDRRERA